MDITNDAGTIYNSKSIPSSTTGIQQPPSPDQMVPITTWKGADAVVGGGSAIAVLNEYLYYFSPMAGGQIPVSQESVAITATMVYDTSDGTMQCTLVIGTNTGNFSFSPVIKGDHGLEQGMNLQKTITQGSQTYITSPGGSYSPASTVTYTATVAHMPYPSTMNSLNIDLGMIYNNPYKLSYINKTPNNIIVKLK